MVVNANFNNYKNFNYYDKGEYFDDVYTVSPLVLAAKYGNVDIVLALIQAGANVNYRTDYYTPLLVAIHCNHKNVIEKLLKHGADVNDSFIAALKSCRKNASDILSYAHSYHAYKTNHPSTHNDIIKTLISYGANVNYIFNDSYSIKISPLMIAAEMGNLSIVKMLLEQGVDINHCEGNNTTALTAAIYSKNMKIVSFLLSQGADINAGPSIDKTDNKYSHDFYVKEAKHKLLLNAAEANLSDMIKLILDKKIITDINISNEEGNTALMTAVDRDSTHAVKLLLSYGADPTRKNAKGQDAEKLADCSPENFHLIKEAKKKFEKINSLNKPSKRIEEKYIPQMGDYLLQSVTEQIQMIEKFGNLSQLNSLKDILEKNVNIVNAKIISQITEVKSENNSPSLITKANLFSISINQKNKEDQKKLMDENYFNKCG